MALVVRTWNVFHGNAQPPERRAFLQEMIELVTEDRPDVVCLQELPLWSLRRLEGWSGMQVVAEVAARSRLGPLWELGRVLTTLHHGALRSLLTGQANAILLARRTRVLLRDRLVLNPAWFRRERGDDVPGWGRNRRVCQLVRVEAAEGSAVVANLHLTSHPGSTLAAEAELERALEWIDDRAAEGEPTILCGDFNLRPELAAHGFSGAGTGIDHILVRGVRAAPPLIWPAERHSLNGRLLSDHAPVEVVVD